MKARSRLVYTLFVILGMLALPLAACSMVGEIPGTPAAFWPPVPPVASYNLQVRLDPQAKTLIGHAAISYHNTSDVPIPNAVFHLYLNAFRDTNTLFLKEGGSAHRTNSWEAGHPGWIEVTALRLADGRPLELQLLEDGTLARAVLPEAVQPGGELALEVDFKAQLPRVFARTGFYEDFFLVGQWFPKLGVWQAGGWNAYPFHVNAEFFADFGVYDVAITLPQGYVTGGVGLPQETQNNDDGTQTVRYHAEGVIDFAWTASPQFRQAAREVQGIQILYLYLPEHAFTVERVLDAAEAAVTHFGEWFGPYPYPRLTVVDVPEAASGAGGMEYPTFVTAGLEDATGLGLPAGRIDRFLEATVVHEIGHQWWQSMVAFNEAEEPWLDEGFTDYATVRLMDKVYGPYNLVDAGNLKVSYLDMRRLEYVMDPQTPMYGKAWEFQGLMTYDIAAYSKPALGLSTLENILGEETMLRVMSTFFGQYRFAHPTTQDFRRVAEAASGRDLAWFFDGLVYGSGVLNYAVTKVDEHAVTVARQGDLALPVEIQVTLGNGSSQLLAWDGKEAEKTFSFPGQKVSSAQIDPQHKLLLDLQWGDNGLRRFTDFWSWLALDTRLLYQFQNWLLYWGGL